LRISAKLLSIPTGEYKDSHPVVTNRKIRRNHTTILASNDKIVLEKMEENITPIEEKNVSSNPSNPMAKKRFL
jgi:hypothetical protein